MARSGKRGFGSMDPDKQREIASKGGRTAHAKGTAHRWTREAASAAGRKGGRVSRGGRGKVDTQDTERSTPITHQPWCGIHADPHHPSQCTCEARTWQPTTPLPEPPDG